MRPIDADALTEKCGDWYVEEGTEEGFIGTLGQLLSVQPETNCSEIPNNWIPCSERLPQQGQEVICQCRANIIKVLKLDANGDWYQDAEHCYMGGFVIAWMPLPEPYRACDEQEVTL